MIISFIGLWIYTKVAVKLGIVDVPNERSSHTTTTLRGGGAVLLVLCGLLVAVDLTSELLLPISLLIGVVTGFLDDRYGLSTIIRFMLYLVAAGMLLLGVLQLHTFETWIWIPLFIVMLGAINTYNFMDGINGITALYSIVFILTVRYVLHIQKDDSFSNTLLVFLAFFVSFLFFNHRKKSLLFLGDAGSVSMGLLACFFVVYLGIKLHSWTPIILLGVYGVDSVGTIIIRLIKRENILQAHKSHLYQDLVHLKNWSHLSVSWMYVITQLLINSIFLYALHYNQHHITVLILFFILTFIFIFLKSRFYGSQLFTNLAN